MDERKDELMIIGVALSGCDLGALSACAVLEALEEKGYEISLISTCCMPSITAMMRACGFGRSTIHKLAQDFLLSASCEGIGAAVEGMSGLFPSEAAEGDKTLAINSVSIPDGKTITFTNAFSLHTETLQTFPLSGARDALGATISLTSDPDGFRYGERLLCDYSAWYGCPVYPLKMTGISKSVSVSFLPEAPGNPYEALVKQAIAKNSNKADVHIPLEFKAGLENFDDYVETAISQIEGSINKIYWRTLF